MDMPYLPELKYRKRATTSIDINLLAAFEALSKETRIPMSRLYDEAIGDLLAKYGKPVPTLKRDEE